MDTWSAEQITRTPRWLGYVGVAIYGPMTVACTMLDGISGWAMFREQFWPSVWILGFGYFGTLVCLNMVRLHDQATKHLKGLRHG